jgi:hypothetical protein
MSTVTGGQGNIVTNGLVLNLDAANPRSYPQPYNGVTWSNLVSISSSISGSLINGPTYNSTNGGNIIFDGVDDYINTSDIPFRFNTTFTLSVWFYWDNISKNKSLLGKRNGSPFNQYSIFIGADLNGNPGNKVNFFAREDSSVGLYDTFIQYTLSNAGIYNATAVLNTTTQNLYVNGVLQGTTTIDYTGKTFNISGRNLLIAAVLDNTNTGTINNFNNKIYQTSIYNRALSASEILQNFNATRARFSV